MIQEIKQIKGQNLIDLELTPYNFVMSLTELDDNDDEAIIDKVKEYLQLSKIDVPSNNYYVVGVWQYMINQLTKLMDLRKNLSDDTPNVDLIQAGAHMLQNLGYMVELMQLAQGDYIKALQLAELPYHQIYWLSYYTKVNNTITENYRKIIEKKK
ncbi:hypothetical protein HX088_11195 [Empedobacter sp. 225-1]|uniref:hypothetical protein n=1 Tax=Empedobacter sp. 225-1 TaxID=2746725 RepID=UPI0025757431|nr:hypothetical protein [Empedobacter sp. 225-1]MDM1523831.1 hypothetical protein [Empedobacter sp. 225-1]